MAEVVVPWLQLTILLTVATASHFAFKRAQIPTIVGEILIGILLGPSLLGQILAPGNGGYFFDPLFTGIFAALGAIVLLFIIGLDTDITAIYSRKNIAIAIGGVILPWVSGYFLADVMLPSETFAAKVFIGAMLVATSVAVSAAVLLEMNAVKTEVAKTLIGAAVVDDVLGLIVLSVSIGLSSGTFSAVNVLLLAVGALLFIGIGAFAGIKYSTRLVNWAERRGQRAGFKHTGFTIGLGLTFLYAFVANYAGLHPIVGAFLAGAAFSKSEVTYDFKQGAEYLGAIFTPIFFVSIGMQVNLAALWDLLSRDLNILFFGIALTAVAIAAKIVGCWIPARLFGMSQGRSIAVGVGMAPRGEVGLVIAATALSLAVISPELYSIAILVIVLTTILPPPLFRWCLARCVRGELELKLAGLEKRA